MKKLRLEPEALAVQGFSTADAQDGNGTVHGAEHTWQGVSCWGASCQAACQDPSNNVYETSPCIC